MNKVLVANRGEIALRILRTLKEMGIQTVAVFSEADRTAPFVRMADEAVCIGPAPSSESYLKGDLILEICEELGVDGIHPGYGFLSENAGFAGAAKEKGVTFIGPEAYAIETMGSKLAAKQAVSKYDIPLVPGTEEAITDVQKGIAIAEEIGYPVLIKASAGGGGKGMRIIENSEEFESQMKRAISEAESSFGDGAVFLEKFVTSPRHIEIQVLADKHGTVLHLFERECSIQRRHQKVIEEAPSAVLTPELRERMGQAACDVARACDYVGAGTVEFLVDDKLNFYFLEMNTRLQVEHPVTEMITGIDLVREQVKIARGEKLSIKQEDLEISGHALEARVYAEDPYANFLPAIGTLETYQTPQGPGVRVDDGYEEGMAIPVHYDSMIAKLIVHAPTREAAIVRMTRAIDEYKIRGFATTLPFCKYAINTEPFKSGKFDTNFVKHHFKPEDLAAHNREEEEVAALMHATLFKEKQEAFTSPELSPSEAWLKRHD